MLACVGRCPWYPAAAYAAGMVRVTTGITYRPLIEHLKAQPATPVTYTFAEIEVMIDRPLPRSAYARGWWRTFRTIRRSLHAAGWIAVNVDLTHHSVMFTRAPKI